MLIVVCFASCPISHLDCPTKRLLRYHMLLPPHGLHCAALLWDLVLTTQQANGLYIYICRFCGIVVIFCELLMLRHLIEITLIFNNVHNWQWCKLSRKLMLCCCYCCGMKTMVMTNISLQILTLKWCLCGFRVLILGGSGGVGTFAIQVRTYVGAFLQVLHIHDWVYYTLDVFHAYSVLSSKICAIQEGNVLPPV